jgi:hypothetical protein
VQVAEEAVDGLIAILLARLTNVPMSMLPGGYRKAGGMGWGSATKGLRMLGFQNLSAN